MQKFFHRTVSIFLLVFLGVAFSSSPLFGYDIEEKLKELGIPVNQSESNKKVLVITAGKNAVVVDRDKFEDIQMRVICAVVPEITPTKAQKEVLEKSIREFSEKTKEDKKKALQSGVWGVDEDLFCFFMLIPMDASDYQLRNAISKCSKVNPPFDISESKFKNAIKRVLDEDYNAQLSVKVVGGGIGFIEWLTDKKIDESDGFWKLEWNAKTIGKIDMSDCPVDFRKAYRRHQAAWNYMVDVNLEIKQWKQKYDSASGLIEGFFRGLTGDLDMPYEARQAADQLQAHYNAARKAIRDTFMEVLDIADDYGVNTAPYR